MYKVYRNLSKKYFKMTNIYINFMKNMYLKKKVFNKKKINKKVFEKIYNHEFLLIKKYFNNKKKIKVLEIGAGWGFWSLQANKKFDVSSVEISKTRRMFIKKNKIKVYSSVKNLKGKFHFIFSDQTFEHLTNPYLTLKKFQNSFQNTG